VRSRDGSPITFVREHTQSSELGFPHPLSRRRVCPPPFCPGGSTLAAGEGWGSPNSDKGTYTVVLYIYLYFVLGRLDHLSCYMDLIQPKCLAGIFRDASSKGQTGRELPFRDTLVRDEQTLHPKAVGGTEQPDTIPQFLNFM
jgi:hypothetical protein